MNISADAAQSGPTLRAPQGQRLSGALGPSHQGHGHLCPLPCAPAPPTPGLGLSPSWVTLCPRRPFSARVPCPSPMPPLPLAAEEKQGLHVPSGPGPSYPSYLGALDWLQTWPAWGPCLALLLLEPSCSLTLSSGFLWPCPKAGRWLTLGPPQGLLQGAPRGGRFCTKNAAKCNHTYNRQPAGICRMTQGTQT